ncbi:MAG: glycosyltransferase family 9 protein [Silvanigrellaceae bacterium]
MKVGVFNTAFVGDLVLMGRLIDALHRDGHEIVLFSNSAGCALYKFDSRIQSRIVVSKGRGVDKISAIGRIAGQIREQKTDVLVLAHRSFTSGLLALLSGHKKVLTFADGSIAARFFQRFSTEDCRHESERYLELARTVVSERSFLDSELRIMGDTSLSKFSSAFPDFFDSSSVDFFVCAPGSVWETKRYPADLLAQAIVRILEQRPGLRCVISGGPGDAHAIDKVFSCMRVDKKFPEVASRIIDARHCLPLPELIELIRRASFVLTPDSAPLHIGSATNTRTFAFFGPTPHSTGLGPLSANSEILDYPSIVGRSLECQPCSKHGHRTCPLGHHSCLADLPPDAVATRVVESFRTNG